MKKLFFVTAGLVIALIMHVKAQEPTASQGKQYLEMGDYFRWANVLNGNGDMVKTLAAYQKSAGLNYPDGIAALGEMYWRGKGGLNKDITKAIELFRKAYDLGSGRACSNLAIAYGHGIGCEIDYEKMIAYLKEGVARGDHFSIMNMGEKFYKGWGVEQSYEKAIPYFERAAQMRNATANYFLGLCYRNGYGVKKDEQKGREYLAKAAKIYTDPGRELKRSQPELDAAKKITGKEIDTPDSFVKARHGAKAAELDGEWEGYLSFYDWSGKHKLNEKKIGLTVKTNGDHLEGTWQQDGTSFRIEGFSNQYGIVFNSGEFNCVDYYAGKVRLKINTGSFDAYKQGQKTVLAGNISLYSVSLKEPERPTCIVLVKKENGKEKKEETQKYAVLPEKQLAVQPAQLPVQAADNVLSQPSVEAPVAQNVEKPILASQLPEMGINSRVWPNPFNEQISVEYRIAAGSEVEMRLISISGQLVRVLSKEKQEAGLHTQQFNVQVTPGTYVLQIVANGMKASHVIIKK